MLRLKVKPFIEHEENMERHDDTERVDEAELFRHAQPGTVLRKIDEYKTEKDNRTSTNERRQS